jgi:biopolymer transport protein ExbD
MARRILDTTSGGVDLGIIITPMLDMAFQLLAFFIMTYNPPAREASVEGQLLPPSKSSPAKVGKDQKSLPDLTAPGNLTLVVRAVPAGKMRDPTLVAGQPTLIYLKKPADAKPREIARVKLPAPGPNAPPADWPQALKALAEELAACRAIAAEKDLRVYIQADRSLRYGYFIAIQDVAKAAGFATIGFNAPAD